MYMIQYGYRNSTASTIQLFTEAAPMIEYVQKLLEKENANFYVEILKTENYVSVSKSSSYALPSYIDAIVM